MRSVSRCVHLLISCMASSQITTFPVYDHVIKRILEHSKLSLDLKPSLSSPDYRVNVTYLSRLKQYNHRVPWCNIWSMCLLSGTYFRQALWSQVSTCPKKTKTIVADIFGRGIIPLVRFLLFSNSTSSTAPRGPVLHEVYRVRRLSRAALIAQLRRQVATRWT